MPVVPGDADPPRADELRVDDPQRLRRGGRRSDAQIAIAPRAALRARALLAQLLETELACRAVGPGQRDAMVTLDIDRDRCQRRSHPAPVSQSPRVGRTARSKRGPGERELTARGSGTTVGRILEQEEGRRG